MMDWEELKKAYFQRWEGKIHPYHLPMHYEAGLMEIDKGLLEIEEILRDGGMEGLGYQPQEEKIRTIGEGAGALNEYIGTLAGEVDRQIDQPLYKGFQNEAAELLSRIKLENYETENTLGVHTRHKMTNEYGDPYTYDSVKKLTFADFLGITSIDKNKAGALVNMPEAFQAFTNMFAMEYDSIKGELANPDGSPVDLESYLKMVHAYGEFDNKMDKPVLEFVSGLLDIIFIKPLVEMCIGHDLITGEDLGDFERGMKGVFAVVDVASMLVGIKASGAVKLFSKGSLQLAGKTTLVGAMSYAAAYGTGKLGEELGLPWPVTLLLSLGAGVAVAKVGSRYVFTDGTGKVLLEADADEVDALRGGFDQDGINRLNHESLDAAGNRLQGAGGAKTSGSAFGEMNPTDTARYNQYWDDVAKGLDTNTRVKLNQWEYRPNADLYNKYKSVYDNSKYFNQATGDVIYPGTKGDINTGGFTKGKYDIETISKGDIIDRYGNNGSGKYFSPDGASFEERALPPFMKDQSYTRYEVKVPFDAKTGTVASWFDQPGGGKQILTEYSVDELLDLGWIKEIK